MEQKMSRAALIKRNVSFISGGELVFLHRAEGGRGLFWHICPPSCLNTNEPEQSFTPLDSCCLSPIICIVGAKKNCITPKQFRLLMCIRSKGWMTSCKEVYRQLSGPRDQAITLKRKNKKNLKELLSNFHRREIKRRFSSPHMHVLHQRGIRGDSVT